MVLPILYGLPVSIALVLRGRLRFIAVPMQLVPPLVWCVGLILLGFVLQMAAPGVYRFLLSDPGFSIGNLLGFAFIIFGLFKADHRAKMWEDFAATTLTRYGKLL